MDLFQQVLNRAEKDGQMDPQLAAAMSDKDIQYWNINKLPLPPVLVNLPENVVSDLQKIIENIRQISESKSAQVIGFTSATRKQGTSSLLSLLSLLMAARQKMSYKQAQQKKKEGEDGPSSKHGVLLIDGQIRNPSLHDKFGLQQGGGILEILENEFQSIRLMNSIESSALTIVTTSLYKNSHLTESHLDKFQNLLNNARKRVKFIFLDIPPLLTYSEGLAMCGLCDGVIMVVQAGDKRFEVIKEARRHLERAEVPILGGILNRREYHIPSWVYRNI